MCATEALWVYALGVPLYISILKLRQKGVSVFLDGPADHPVQTVETVEVVEPAHTNDTTV
jgi:hypothetical protein